MIDDVIKRHFTTGLEAGTQTVYDLFNWQTIDIELKNRQTGKIIFEMKNCEFPEGYSQNACNIIASKYFRRKGIPSTLGYERSMREVADRMVGFWADALMDEGIIDNKEQWQILYDELVYAFLKQWWAPNSPQWFNTGLYRNYKISGDSDGLFYYDTEKEQVVTAQSRYERTQASACFILSIEDQLLGPNSISDHYVSETRLFKGGSGVGTNFSNLRGENEKLSSGGFSSGMMSFLVGLDKNAGAIKSGGTTRRAAKMVIVDVDHPEIENFIDWKMLEEEKVKALGKMGYDTSIDGEAYQTVSGQNANNSVRLTGEFMDAVKEIKEGRDSNFTLKGRVDDSVNKNISVKALWDKINLATWSCADPGLQFDDIFNQWHTCPAGEDGILNAKHNRINATNPCSEYAFLDNTACNLASINLYGFLEPKSKTIRVEDYIHLVGLIQLILEASIHHGQFPTESVARKSHGFRTTGLGVANAASVVMAMGYPYHSVESRALIASLIGLMTGHSYYTSALMAEKIGPFKHYELNKPYMNRVIRNHGRVAGALKDKYEDLSYTPHKINHNLLEEMGQENLSQALKTSWKHAIDHGEKHGYRNAQVSAIAPTGTISFAMDCGATSVEPFYNHIVMKRLIGGGVMEMINPVMQTALENLNYSEKQIEDIMSYLLTRDEDGRLVHIDFNQAPHIKPEHVAIFDTAGDISPEGHVLMVSAVTPMVSGSVSKTVNMKNDATIKDVENIHLLAYQTGTKAIAVYRDGCKVSQPLSSFDEESKEFKLENLTYQDLLDYAKKSDSSVPVRLRPDGMRESRTHAAKIGDIELYITIGFYDDGQIAEIFVSTDKDGTVVKGLLASLSKSISNMLQYKIPPEKISRMLRGQKYEPAGFVSRHPYIKYASSISDLISKVIDFECGDYSRCQVKPHQTNVERKTFKEKKQKTKPVVEEYQPYAAPQVTGEKLYDSICAQCGSDQMIQSGTCKVCLDCGSTTGCS